MVDFIDSFNKGIEAAKKAEHNKDEIDSVIEAMNVQLGNVSAGKVKVEIKLKTNPLADFFASAAKTPVKGSYWAVVAYNPLAESSSPKELARWKSDPNGYPCEIITDAGDVYCEDKIALEKAFNFMLGTPDVGKKLLAVMNQK
ncbi:hypothetical protein KDX38_08345 [Pseudomonas sp. CDFA 602]|uniref:hypothetical protein n=1 Tax=Pseudomonas californiensis TaxID=2829823 RepID=UPI001E441B30|nr:hypothetical protein [Pseudomonas californiensis]MCD5993629.1 hypothetical protein [Pseudomonas californiensis]MCD5999224.1 hypothetical protein [Pseudomonas californiensis]